MAPIFFAKTLLICQLGLMWSGESREVFSDLEISETSSLENKALEVKSKHFWTTLQSVTEDMGLDGHVQIYGEVEAVIKSMDATTNTLKSAREFLSEALEILKRVDRIVLSQGLKFGGAATEELAKAGIYPQAEDQDGETGIMVGGRKNFISEALGLVVEGGRYKTILLEDEDERGHDASSLLKEATEGTGAVFQDMARVNKLAHEIARLDFADGLGKALPQSVKDVAKQLQSACHETRRSFFNYLLGMATGFLADALGEKTSSATASEMIEVVQNDLNLDREKRSITTEQEKNDQSEWVCNDKSEGSEASTASSELVEGSGSDSADAEEDDEPFQGL
eukprot:TRINITY_DN48364_c0_g1_i1.p1 TRINITY_DN48364_c0_g1~~TRINITY_DN48364_c0_g1_i1.p1  ORF type:complete len:338 (-),score=81.70 TRINITY_DN48364_c0_g1_i1:249-1262(-)